MNDRSPEACIRRIENGVGVLGLRIKGADVLPSVDSVTICKLIVLDASTLLDHFASDPAEVAS